LSSCLLFYFELRINFKTTFNVEQHSFNTFLTSTTMNNSCFWIKHIASYRIVIDFLLIGWYVERIITDFRLVKSFELGNFRFFTFTITTCRLIGQIILITVELLLYILWNWISHSSCCWIHFYNWMIYVKLWRKTT
jgi:hypothetical protein